MAARIVIGVALVLVMLGPVQDMCQRDGGPGSSCDVTNTTHVSRRAAPSRNPAPACGPRVSGPKAPDPAPGWIGASGMADDSAPRLVLLPGALLDARYVTWTSIDERRAAATLSAPGVVV